MRSSADVTIAGLRTLGVEKIGLWIDDGNATVTGSDFYGAQYGVRVDNGSSATVSGSSFVGPSIAGANHWGNDFSKANLQGNWWASAGGPHDPSAIDGVVNDNPAGTPVSNHVDYAGFLATAPIRVAGPRVINLQRLAPIAPRVHHRYKADGSAVDAAGTHDGAPVGDASYGQGHDGGQTFLLDGDRRSCGPAAGRSQHAAILGRRRIDRADQCGSVHLRPRASGFGWSTIGDVVIAGSTATVREDVGMLSGLSQTFVVPQGVNTLTFTLGGLTLDVGSGNHPPEAFEVVMLNAETSLSLFPSMAGLAGGDAVLNIQADGSVFFANGVSVSGISQSGEKLASFNQPIDVTISLPTAPQQASATLYFDLIGFGQDDSSASVSNIDLRTDVLSWQNSIDRHDVDNSGQVQPLEALRIINELKRIINQLNRARFHDRKDSILFTITETVGPPPFLDVSGDGRVTALDALQVINRIFRDNSVSQDEPKPEVLSWQNPVDRHDVDNSGDVSAVDALRIVNELNTPRFHDRPDTTLFPITETLAPPPFLDVTGDGQITAFDALQVINRIFRDSLADRRSQPEGEADPPAAAAPVHPHHFAAAIASGWEDSDDALERLVMDDQVDAVTTDSALLQWVDDSGL